MQQVAYNSILGSENYWEEFKKCTRGLLMKTSDDDLKKFCSEWTRKLIHALLGEFIKCHSMLRSEESHRRVKGGLTLRDSLYCATTKKSKKELSYKTTTKKYNTE